MMTTKLASALACGVCMVALAPPAGAQTRTYNIAAGSLKSALDSYSRQSGRPIIYKADQVRSARSGGASGAMSAEAALNEILAGTSFRAQKDSSGAIAIVRLGNGQSAGDPQAASPGAGDKESDQSASIEQSSDIVVTGTNIRGQTDQFAPVARYSRDRLDREGYATVGDAILGLPQNFGGGTSLTTGGRGATGGSGNQGVNLRGLGDDATLVLLNGHRLAPGGTNGTSVNLSPIPTSAIDRIEVLSDGASAIYGADAVAGVVNIILRDNFDGMETRMRGQLTSGGGGGSIQLGQTFGTHWQNGRLLLTYEHSEDDALDANDRSWSAALSDPNTLTPRIVRNGLFGSAAQTLGPVKLTADGYFNFQNATTYFSGPQRAFLKQTSKDKQYGGTVGARVAISNNWEFNLFGTAALSDYYAPTYTASDFSKGLIDHSNTRVYDLQASLSGSLFALPGGDAKIVVGGSRRWEKYSGGTGTIPLVGALPTVVSDRDITAGFAELYLPIVGPSNSIPLVNTLSLNLAGRYERYSKIGTTSNPKIGVRWSPFAGLALRGSYGTSFHAPALNILVDKISIAQLALYAPTLADTAKPALLVSRTSSSSLRPETSRSWNLGFDLDPDFAPDLHLQLSYFRINYRNRIVIPTWPRSGATYHDGDVPATANPDPALVAYYVANAGLLQNRAPGIATVNNVVYLLDQTSINASRSFVDGLDASVRYGVPLGGGKLDLNLDATYLLGETFQFFPSSAVLDRRNTVGNPNSIKLKAGATWTHDRFSTSGFLNFVGRYHDVNALVGANDKVPSWTTVDLSANYRFGRAGEGATPAATIGLAVRNLFDSAPPAIPSAFAALDGNDFGLPYDSANANPFGRTISVQLTFHW